MKEEWREDGGKDGGREEGREKWRGGGREDWYMIYMYSLITKRQLNTSHY